MILHRAYRDVQRCREKYGEAWAEYERRTPYLLIPVSVPILRAIFQLTPPSMCSRFCLCVRDTILVIIHIVSFFKQLFGPTHQ